MKNASSFSTTVLALFLTTVVTHAAENGQSILSATGTQGGLVVHLGCGDGELTAELCASDSLLVYGLDADGNDVDEARQYIRSRNLYGRVSVGQLDGAKLPFIDNLVTLVVAEEISVPMNEIMRVLHPYGVAYIGGEKTVKVLPEEVDEWTHYLHGADNNAVAHDSLVAPPRHMQFLAAPLWSRHHDRLASFSSVVTAKGRLFYINDNGPVFDPSEAGQWTITARNAFNGVFLWQKPISSWTDIMRRFRSGPVQLQRLLVTDGDRVFVTLGLDEPASVLDAPTGEEITVLEGTEKAEEFVLAGGVLYVQIGEDGAEHALIERGDARGVDYKTTKLIKAMDVSTGTTLWRWPADKTAEIMPRTLAVSDGNVFFQESGETVCLDASSGQQLWRTNLVVKPQPAKPTPKPAAPDKAKRNKRRAKPKKSKTGRSLGWTFATLVVQDGVVLSCDGNTLLALNAKSGELLWQCPAKTPFGKTPSVDILVVNGVVWTSPGLNEGRDLKTGEVLSTNNLGEELVTAGHHHRCYRNKATDRYVIQGYRGLEFRDTQGDDHCRHNWIRGICQYGIMPANGMVYLPPHNCGCYPEAKLFGLWTLKASESTFDVDGLTYGTAFDKGPAYGQIGNRKSAIKNPDDWPMHRHDPRRSGVQPSPISAKDIAWNVELAGRLSATVIAQGTLVVSAVSSHQVLAFDANSGERRWSFTAGGPVDSAPTIYGDAVLFGSADGQVTCLRLSDGELVWRFQAAPANLNTVALGQVESLWPVHGSILITDDTAYFTAGRSSYIDGGLFLYGLEPISGDVKYQQRVNSPPAEAITNTSDFAKEGFSQNAVDFKTKRSPDHSDAFSMTGNLSDILVADDDAVYLRHAKFDKQLKPTGEWTHHLFSTSRLLDDTESYRAHWFYGNGDFSRLPVAYEWLTRGSYGGFTSPLGKFLVFDEKNLWGAGWKSLALYTTDITDIDQRLPKDFPKGQGDMVHKSLADTLPIHPRAMLKAGNVLYMAGYPSDSTIPHFYGEPIKDKGILLEIDAISGEVLSQTDLPASPVFDGMSAASGKLYMSLENGSVMCLE